MVIDDVVHEHVVAAICTAIRASRLIGDSQLVTRPPPLTKMMRRAPEEGGGFSSTRGFGVVCHADAIDDALAKVPLLAPFVPVAMDVAARRRVRPMSTIERLAASVFDDVNAIYLNVLVVPPGAAVERHTDATLGTAADDPRTLTPLVVAVLYVDIPDDLVGGELRLFQAGALLHTITPKNGRFVMFDGRLEHEVTATMASGPRISCVAELYRLPRVRLRQVPRVRVQSNGFAEVLRRFPLLS